MRARRRATLSGVAALQVTLVMPVVLLLIAAVAQVASWQHAVHIAQSAASSGVEAARVRGGSDGGGTSAALEAAAQFHSLRNVQVVVARTATQVHVEVRGTAPSLLGISLPVTASADGPLEPTP